MLFDQCIVPLGTSQVALWLRPWDDDVDYGRNTRHHIDHGTLKHCAKFAFGAPGIPGYWAEFGFRHLENITTPEHQSGILEALFSPPFDPRFFRPFDVGVLAMGAVLCDILCPRRGA
jgi:hypothetical protein